MFCLKEKDRPLVRKLLSAGCCVRCVLRFCSVGNSSSYRRTEQEIHKDLLAFIGELESQNASGEEKAEEPLNKRMRTDEESITECDSPSDVCPVCLGVLQHFCSPTFVKQVSDTVKKHQYELESLVLTVSLPAQLLVREHSCWLYVKGEIRDKSMCLGKDDVVQVKDAFKWAVQGKIGQELNAPVLAKSPCEVNVGFVHPETDEDCHFLANSCPDCFKPTKNKASIFTRMAVVKALEKISEQTFCRQVLSMSTTETEEQMLSAGHHGAPHLCLHCWCVQGRYNKFSRELPQTPWLIDGERRMEGSVEELITTPLLSSFRADGLNFSSSGREDVDVINQSSDKVRVRDLQIVSREAISRMKEGEEEKTKTYSALIWTQKIIDQSDLDFLENIKRLVHSMSAVPLDTHHFTLKLHTQAGTYIKEFVHGDFGRTKPNLCDLLKTEADILELDVESVDIDWPPAIPD
ncbi:hypothetical protein DNTS_017160 [Danionella cerebrum]|uniref:tRNA pseudouridine(55) synthase n=1 Tax=Danionella cerebrum TaxID=2873325 RepID=A0A553NGB5_9TELE|nr:hypothetical protein DNTS_017160 [Danionella translucida]